MLSHWETCRSPQLSRHRHSLTSIHCGFFQVVWESL
jgi:hypothetical protein